MGRVGQSLVALAPGGGQGRGWRGSRAKGTLRLDEVTPAADSHRDCGEPVMGEALVKTWQPSCSDLDLDQDQNLDLTRAALAPRQATSPESPDLGDRTSAVPSRMAEDYVLDQDKLAKASKM